MSSISSKQGKLLSIHMPRDREIGPQKRSARAGSRLAPQERELLALS